MTLKVRIFRLNLFLVYFTWFIYLSLVYFNIIKDISIDNFIKYFIFSIVPILSLQKKTIF